MRSPGLALLVTTVLATLSACGTTPDSAAPNASAGGCEATERESFNALHRQADELFADVPHVEEESSSCEETGQPGASVVVTSSRWITLAETETFLSEHNWTPRRNHPQTWTCPDPSTCKAHLVKATEADGKSFIQIYLSAD